VGVLAEKLLDEMAVACGSILRTLREGGESQGDKWSNCAGTSTPSCSCFCSSC